MARPNVKTTLTDEGAVIASQEGNSSFVAGYLDTDLYPNNMLGSLGFTHEREQGYMTIESIGDWNERLSTVQPTGYNELYEETDFGQINYNPFVHFDGIKETFVAGNTYSGGTFERWNSPEHTDWEYDWNFIENYLSYGGSITIFSAKSGENSTGLSISRAKNKSIPVDAFLSQFYTQNNDIRSIVDNRQDCIAVTSIPSEHVAGLNLGRSPSGAIGDPPESFFIYWAGSTWGYTAGAMYEQLPIGVAKRPLDVPFVQNTGDNKTPQDRVILSSFVYDTRAKTNYDGTYTPQHASTAEFIDYARNSAIGLNEESYGVRGCTFDRNLLSGVKGITGLTLFGSSDASTNAARIISGKLHYYDNVTDSYEPLFTSWPVDVQERLKQASGLTLFANSLAYAPVGRIGVFKNAYSFQQWQSFACHTKDIFTPTDANGDPQVAGPRKLHQVALPANWRDPFSWYLDPLFGYLYEGYDILPNGRFTDLTGVGNQEKSSQYMDLRQSLNPQFDFINAMCGTGGDGSSPAGYTGWIPSQERRDAMATQFDLLGASAAFHEFRKENNIFAQGTDGASLGATASRYWGATCCTAGGIPDFIFELAGKTPDICIDYATAGITARGVTAVGSTYEAYIAYSKPFPDITITGMANIFGEYIGPNYAYDTVDGKDGPFSEFLKGINSTENVSSSMFSSFTRPDSEPTGPGQLGKSILMYPLVADDSESGFGLTADKTNYFYAFSTNWHTAGQVSALNTNLDKNWPTDRVATDREFSGHWYNVAPYMGGFIDSSIGKISTPGGTLERNFFGNTMGNTANSSHDGISSDGVYLLAELDVVQQTNGIPVTGFAPPSQFDPNDVSLANLFSSNAEKYEFPVFGEKFKQDSHLNYGSNEESGQITNKAVEVPFTSDVGGMFARQFRDLEPWFSPANRSVSTVNNLISERYTPSDGEQTELYDNKINFIRNSDGSLRLFGDKTYAPSTSTFSRVNVSNLFIYLKKKLEPLSRRFLFEQNNAKSRELFVSAAEPFLRTLEGSRAITEFRIICDETNNTPDIVDSNQFVADIFIKPVKTINFIKIRFTNVGTSFELE
jgi:hypothetical protein